MPLALFGAIASTRGTLRLETLVRLRWLAVMGQTATILGVHFGLGFDLPLGPCLAVVALSAWFNVALRIRHPVTRRLESGSAVWLLAYDVLQLAVLLFLTGGLQNPFAFLFLAPVFISATALTPQKTLMLGGLVVVCATFLAFFHMPLPWFPDDELRLSTLYLVGIFAALMLSMLFTSFYSRQVAEEGRQLADALAATELVLEREQHLSQLDGLAAAAAHELGTPLATITVVAKELERALPKGSPHAEDVALLREQAQRCRDILAKISQLSSGDAPFETPPIRVLLEEVIAPYREFEREIAILTPGDGSEEPLVRRNPGLLYGLGNIVENAVDFAGKRVEIEVAWNDREVLIVIGDDGPGFAPEILDRIGEPYITSRGRLRGRKGGDPEATGLGLGFFIAKTLLERSGATLAFTNRYVPLTGALVRIRWPREQIDERLRRDAAPEDMAEI